MVRLLLEKSSKSDTGSKNATRALKLAVGNNCNDIVVELLSRGFSFEGAESSKGKLKDLGLADNTIESLLKLKLSYENDPADI